ncbi:hypothetical protein HAL013_16480 [Helicobacter ailurogastricus]|uniref:Uncharacterized protein n=1 Tax=Helicobacter ailurogastricus TaxID=1578720 RepID=A0A0K2XBH0_9HELI|nr:hypothetical protein HAL013_16480 [Helicobacter ailurogastricus]
MNVLAERFRGIYALALKSKTETEITEQSSSLRLILPN